MLYCILFYQIIFTFTAII